MDIVEARKARVSRLLGQMHGCWTKAWMYREIVAHWRYIAPILVGFNRLFALIAGTDPNNSRTDEQRLSKAVLKHNDIYRDRLLENEIESFVDLGDALLMTGQQRHHFFTTFLKLDWMRRSAISVKDLFLYCGLRRSRAADAFFPHISRHHSYRQFKDRMEIVPFLAALFSFCSLPAPKVHQSDLLS
jgi:hypothetical protein